MFSIFSIIFISFSFLLGIFYLSVCHCEHVLHTVEVTFKSLDLLLVNYMQVCNAPFTYLIDQNVHF